MVTAAAGKPSWSVSEVLWWAEVLPRPEEAPKARPGAQSSQMGEDGCEGA